MNDLDNQTLDKKSWAWYDLLGQSIGKLLTVTKLTVTSTTTLATSLTGVLRADSGIVTVATSAQAFRTSDVTPVIVATNTLVSASHTLGTIPMIVMLEYICLTAEQGYSIGDVMQLHGAWNGAASFYPFVVYKTTTTLGILPSAGYVIYGTHKTTGALFTPTGASWAYRFVYL